MLESLWASVTNTLFSDLAVEFWATILGANSLFEREASWAGSSDAFVTLKLPSLLAASSDALSVVESEAWLARLVAASVVESETGFALEQDALVFLDAEVVTSRAELQMALSVLQVVALSAVDLSASFLVELVAWRALVSDTLVVNEVEVLWTLGQLAGSFWSEGVTLLADFVARVLEHLVAGRAGMSNALVAESLETLGGVTVDQNALVLFELVTFTAFSLDADAVLSLETDWALGLDTVLSDSDVTSEAWN